MNLPVYRDLYHLNVSLLNIIENIPKIHRHTLGNRIVDTGLSSLRLLQRAYDATSHLERLHEAQERERIAYEELQKMRKRAEKAERELERYERVSRQREESLSMHYMR